MTRKEKHEIAVAVKAIMNENCNEIRDAYKAKYGSLKGLRSYVRQECVAFWTDCNPYLDKPYLDYSNIKMEDGTIINLDDLWCFIRDILNER